jgi:hypothetical protein
MANKVSTSGQVAHPTIGSLKKPALGRAVDVVIFEEQFQNYGFDNAVQPWLMVPAGETRRVWLYHGFGKQVRTDRAGILHVTTIHVDSYKALLVIQSLGIPGTDRVLVGNARPALDVSVKRKVTARVAFFYVNRGPNGTSRDPNNLDSLIAAANAILEPQANVVIERVPVTNPILSIPNLPRAVHYGSHWNMVTEKGVSSADLNVYFVGDYTGSTDHKHRKNKRDTEAETMEKSCIFEDDVAGEEAVTLAHELVHRMLGEEKEVALGFREGHSLAPGDLMFVGGDSTGRKIPRAQVDLINPD